MTVTPLLPEDGWQPLRLTEWWEGGPGGSLPRLQPPLLCGKAQPFRAAPKIKKEAAPQLSFVIPTHAKLDPPNSIPYMLKFPEHPERWWQKRLVDDNGNPLPAELAVLRLILRKGEQGAWLNSRGTRTGVTDLARTPEGKLKTKRTELPEFVSDLLKTFYKMPNVTKGIFDLVIWNESSRKVRFVEVKCPHWDRLTPEQKAFTKIAGRHNIETAVIEWEFGC